MAKECYLEIDGKRTKLTDEQLKALGLYEEPKKSPFDRVEIRENYYLINSCGELESVKDYYWNSDKARHDIANYCTDKSLMHQRALHEKLNRLLWRFSMENDGNKICWNQPANNWCLFMDETRKRVKVIYHTWIKFECSVYFYTKEIAEKEIKEVVEPIMEKHPDFIW